MPDTTSPGDEPAAAGSSGPKKMIMTVVLAVVLVGVGYVLGGKMSGGSGAAAEASADGHVTEQSEGDHEDDHAAAHPAQVIDLDPINVNLAEGHYLRVAISLGISTEPDGHGGETHFPTAAASDVVLHTFSGRLMADLSTVDGREAARLELAEGLTHHYGDEVVSVYFTEFVMQ